MNTAWPNLSFHKGHEQRLVICLEEETLALLRETFTVIAMNSSYFSALILMYHYLVTQAISSTLQLVWYAKETLQHQLSVHMAMFALLMDTTEQKEDLKSVLMDTGLLLVMFIGT